MEIRQSLFLFAALVATCPGEDAVIKPPPLPPLLPTVAATPARGTAWLGFSIRKPDAAVMAQTPGLPAGIGFVIQAVTPGGPADLAKLSPMDVLWKFGDQMLVNQGQLATLLSLQHPGDEVTLAVFREGKPVDIKVRLGETPANPKEFSRDVVDAAILSDEGSPMKIVNILDRTATFSNADGDASVRREGEGYKVLITGPDKRVIYDGLLPADGNLSAIPDEWHRRICVLRRSLDHALENRLVPVRSPRPRVVPPPPAVPPAPVEGSPPPPGTASKH